MKPCRILSALTILLAISAGIVTSATAQEATSAPQRLAKIRDSVIYRDDKMHAAFPSIISLSENELLCAFRRAPSRRALYEVGHDSHTHPNSYLVTVRSTDGGETFTTLPQLLYAHPFGGSQDPCLLKLNDGTLVCSSYGWASMTADELKARSKTLQVGGFGFLGGYLLHSNDDGATWDGPTYPPALPGNQTENAHGNPLPTYNRGEMLQLEDGTILWAVVKHDHFAPLRTSVHLIRSTDGGHTWTDGPVIAADEKVTFNETSLVQTPDGQIAAFLRTDRPDMQAAIARSTDGGKTFQPWEYLGWSGLPLQAIRLKQGGILVVYGYRSKPYGIRARLLADDLSDAKTAPEFILRDDGGSPDLGYPWAVELANGEVLVTYYMNTGDGNRHIAGTWLKVEPTPAK